MGEYHKEHGHGFVRKAVGLAAVGGLVGLALTKGAKPIGAILERAVTSDTAQSLGGLLYGGARSAFQSTEQFAETYLSAEVRAVSHAAEIVEIGTSSFLQSQKRFGSFLEGLRPHVNEKEVFDTLDFTRLFKGLAPSVGVADTASDLDRNLLSHEGINALNERMRAAGVTTKFRNANHQIDVFKELVNNSHHETNRKEIVSYLSQKGHQEDIFHFLEDARAKHEQASTAFKRRFAPNSRSVLLGELSQGHQSFSERAHGMVVKELARRHGVETEQAGKMLQSAIDEQIKHVAKLFPDTHYQLGGVDLLMSSNSGFILDEARQKAVSLSRLARAGQGFIKSALSNIQLPLLPYKFNVQLSAFNIMPKAPGVARQIGSIATQPELQRMAERGVLQHGSWADPGTKVVSAGDRLLAIGEDGLDLAEGRFFVGELKQSAGMRRVARLRSLTAGPYSESLLDFRQGHGKLSTAQKFLQSKAHLFSDAHYDPNSGQFAVRPKHPFLGPLTRFMGGSLKSVDPTGMNPYHLVDLLQQMNPSAMPPEDYNRVLNSVIHEAGKININSDHFFQQFAKNTPDGFTIPGLGGTREGAPGGFSNVFHQLLTNKDGSREIMNILNREMQMVGGRSALSMPGELKDNLSPQLYRAMMSIKSAPDTLGVATLSDVGGIRGVIDQSINGNLGVSSLVDKLHTGMYAQILHGVGVGKYGGYADLAAHVEGIVDAVKGSDSVHAALSEYMDKSQFLRDLSKIGQHTPESIMKTLGSLVKTDSGGDTRALYSRLGEVSSLLLDKHDIFSLTDDNNIRAKLVDVVRESLDNSAHVDVRAKNFVLRNLTINDHNGQGEEWLADSVRQRFHALRAAHAPEYGPNALYNSRFYALPHNGPTAAEMLLNPIQSIRDVYDTSARAGDFARAFVDPTKEHGILSYAAHMISLMPQGVGENVGLGLPHADQLSPLRASAGWWLKRTAPLLVGYELYKNLNANAHEMNLPGVDDMGANLLANAHLMGAGIKDALGITSFEKRLVAAFPGMDQYMHPRTHDEYKEYLEYGEEDVREGRGWIVGSRSAATGGRVKYTRPNYFRRWHSHWTEADNVDISNPEHSFLPNLMHPLAPIKRIITDRDWFVHKHLSDRPYAKGGVGVSEAYPGGSFLTTNNQGAFAGAEGGGAIADMGGVYPSTMMGGGVPLDLVHGLGAGSGYGAGAGTSDPINISLHKAMRKPSIIQSLSNEVAGRVQNIRSQAGLFGAVMSKIPGFPEQSGIKRQSWKTAISNTRMMFGGEYGELTMSVGEFYRRIVHPDSQGDYNPLPNNQASWMPDKFRTGDPYIKSPGGYFNVAGDAYEKLNPWIAPLRVRGSAIGLSVEEILQKWINPTEGLGSEAMEDIVDYGSEAHLLVQRHMNDLGMLLAAETSIYDKEHNISGTIDAIVRGKSGAEIVDVKTQGGKHWGETPEKYIDQITAYMAITGIQRAHLLFSNRDDPTMTRTESFNFDPERWQRILNKVEMARNVATNMVDKGLISPFQTYDILARIDVLSKVAPGSREFVELVEHAESTGGFGGFERQRFEQALDRAKRLQESYRLYPLQGTRTEAHVVKVEAIGGQGEIITDGGTLRLAGVTFNQQAFGTHAPDQVLAQYGIREGKYILARSAQGAWDSDIRADTTTPVIVGHANRKLMASQYASEYRDSDNPMDMRAVGEGVPAATRVWQHLVHLDTMFTNKFLRVRTAVEQLERGEVYGHDDFSWSDITGTLVKPTMAAVASKNPLAAAFKAGLIASLFFSDRRTKGLAWAVGGAIGAGMSMAREGQEIITGRAWKPKSVKKQEEFDEYWDTLEYTKYSTMAEAAKKRARKQEHVDVDALQEGAERSYDVSLGPWATLAIHAQRKAAQTMYGYNEAAGDLQTALNAIPKRHKQLAESVITTGSLKEKQRFYDLISNPEKRVLAKFLGKDWERAPRKEQLSKYYDQHYLPNVDWAGWQENTDMNDLRTRAEAAEGMKVESPTRMAVERAKAATSSVRIPRSHHRTPHRIRRTLESLISQGNFSDVKVKYVIRPSNKSMVNVNMNVFHDQTQQMIAEARGQLYQGEPQT